MAINEIFYNPYTFIELSDKLIAFKDEDIKKYNYSHDVPLGKNTSSGIIEFTLKAETDFIINSGDSKSVNIDNKFFIPGTSIKGAIRNVFEILTLSNIKDKIQDSRYSMRDLRSNDYVLKSDEGKQTSGFLIKLDHKLYVMKCFSEKYSYSEIEDIEGEDLKSIKAISEKYLMLKDGHIFRSEGIYSMWFFSGFMNNKKHEYLFDIPSDFVNQTLYSMRNKECNDFLFIHEKENENNAWRFWKRKLKNYDNLKDIIDDEFKGIVPCFFRLHNVKNNNDKSEIVVKDLGFSFLYRQPYDKSIHDLLPKAYKDLTSDNNALDMSQLIFGYTNSKDSLKGRVSFSNSFLKDAVEGNRRTLVLGSPKPTYYPFYLQQNENNKLDTFFAKDVNISGWKRYLVHSNAHQGIVSNRPRIESTFRPILKGASLTCKIKFHNLYDYELGALLSAVSFHNNLNTYHQIGFAKGYGYGKFSWSNLKITSSTNNNFDVSNYLSKFEDKIKELNAYESWLKVKRQLIDISSGRYSSYKIIRYPNLDKKEFENIKNAKGNLSLKDFTP